MKLNILRANFTIQANCPVQNYFISRQLTPKAKERNLTLLANEEAHNSNKQTGRQGNNFSG